jgi:hypothetical protein
VTVQRAPVDIESVIPNAQEFLQIHRLQPQQAALRSRVKHRQHVARLQVGVMLRQFFEQISDHGFLCRRYRWRSSFAVETTAFLNELHLALRRPR